jgi:chromosome segregation ATPase
LNATLSEKADLLQAEQSAHFETKLALRDALAKLSETESRLSTSTTLMRDLDAEREAHGRTKQELQNVFYKAAEAEARATSSDAAVRGAKTFYDAEKLAHGETKRVLDGLFAKVAKLESSVTETKQELETTGAANRVMLDQTELELKKALTENIQLREERDALHEWRNGMQQHWQRMPA